MIPGVGYVIYTRGEVDATTRLKSHYRFFYSGLARRKSALSLIWLSMMAAGVTSFQWFFWGYSLSFSHSAGNFIGNLDNIGFRQTLAHPSVASPKIPDLLFALYQGMFAAITYVALPHDHVANAILISPPKVSLSPSEQSPNVAACYPASSSCLSGQQ